MTKAEMNQKLKDTYNVCVGKIKGVPVYIERSKVAVTDFFNDKRTKFYIAISLFIQAITCISVFFALWNNKKTTAGVFGALAAVGAALGTLFLVSSLDEDENGKKTFIHFDRCYDEADEDGEISVELIEEEAGEFEEEDDGEVMVFGEDE